MKTLVRWSPFQDFDAMERRMRTFLDEIGIAPAVVPAADVYESDGEYVFELEVPGFDEQELAIEVSDHTLTVKGTRTETKEKEEKTFRLHERLAKEFERRFELPVEADTEKLSAGFEKGILTLYAPKAKAPTSRKVAIGARP